MNLANVMDEIGASLRGINGLRVFPYPVGTATPPAALVVWPDEYIYDGAYGRGMDRMTLQVVLLVGKPSLRPSRDALAKYLDGAGPASVKAAVDGGTYVACDSVTVTKALVDVYNLGGTDYLGAIFDVDIAGRGTS